MSDSPFRTTHLSLAFYWRLQTNKWLISIWNFPLYRRRCLFATVPNILRDVLNYHHLYHQFFEWRKYSLNFFLFYLKRYGLVKFCMKENFIKKQKKFICNCKKEEALFYCICYIVFVKLMKLRKKQVELEAIEKLKYHTWIMSIFNLALKLNLKLLPTFSLLL